VGAVVATIELPPNFDAVPDDAAAAVCARRREKVDGALKAVESIAVAVIHNFEALGVLIVASVAPGHSCSPDVASAYSSISPLRGPLRVDQFRLAHRPALDLLVPRRTLSALEGLEFDRLTAPGGLVEGLNDPHVGQTFLT